MHSQPVRAIFSLTIVVLFGSLFRESASAAEDPPKKKLPPLVIDADSPLMLDEGTKRQRTNELAASVAENSACYVCHENFHDEPLVTLHAKGDVGCVDCHGKSFAHRNDENNTTPPDVMFARNKIDDGCVQCHDTHDVPAAQVVARLHQRVPRGSASQKVVCTQCHGRHKLNHRTVVWDRVTRTLLTGSQESLPGQGGPTLETLKRLAGSWVLAGPDGKPTDKVMSTFRVTAAGSAVVETLFPGEAQEMITVYHQDGDDLFLTHYCAAKNQPRMRCASGTDPNLLQFEFVDATNLPSLEAQHMHAGTIRIIDADHIESRWYAYDKGQATGEVKLDLMRRK